MVVNRGVGRGFFGRATIFVLSLWSRVGSWVLVAKKLGRGRRRVLSNFDDRKVATRICGRRYRDLKVNLDISMSFQAIDVKFLHVSYHVFISISCENRSD